MSFKQKSERKSLQKILSFAVATMNTANALSPLAMPYAAMFKEVNVDYSNLITTGNRTLQQGGQLLDLLFFKTVEAAEYTPHVTIINSPIINETLGGTEDDIYSMQYIHQGGTTLNATIKQYGTQSVGNGGLASMTVIESGGRQIINGGGTSLNIVKNSGATLAVVVAANSTTVVTGLHESGAFSISNGIASNFLMNGGDSQLIINGGLALDTTMFGGGQGIGSGGTAERTIIGSGGYQAVSSGGTANNTILYSGGRQTVGDYYFAGGITNDTIIKSGAGQSVYSGGIANSATIEAGGSQYIGRGGTAQSTTITSGGIQMVYSGGTALNVIQNAGGTITIGELGYDRLSQITGINELGAFSLSNGVTSNFILYTGKQNVYNGGTALSTTVHSGASMQAFWNDATLIDIKQQIGANINVAANPTLNIVITGSNESGAFSLSNGVANNFIIYSGGSMVTGNKGVVNSTTINSAGYADINYGGTANNTIINSGGTQRVYSSYANNTVVHSGGVEYVAMGGTSLNIVQDYGGYVSVGTIMSGYSIRVTGTNESGAFSLSNGVADNFILYDGARQDISSGGTSTNLTQNIGTQVFANVIAGSKTKVTGVNESGFFSLSNGVADNFVLYSGGSQSIGVGGTSTNITQNIGAHVVVSVANDNTKVTGVNESGAFSLSNGVADNFIIYTGAQVVSSGGTANNTILRNNAWQVVSNGGMANNTIIKDGNRQIIYSAGIADTNIISSGAVQFVSTGGTALNTIQSSGGHVFTDVVAGAMTKIVGTNETATFSLSNGVADGFILYSGGSQNVSSGGTSTNIDQRAGGNINVVVDDINNTKVTGTNELGTFILSNGIADGFVFYGDGMQTISSGGSAVNTRMLGGRQMLDGGTAFNTVVDNNTDNNWGAYQDIANGGLASNTTVGRGGQQITSGGTADNSLLTSGGHQFISGGSALNTIVNSNAWQSIDNGYIENTTIESGGYQGIGDHPGWNGDIVVVNTELKSGGTVSLYGWNNESVTVTGFNQHVGGIIKTYVDGSQSNDLLLTGTNVSGAFGINAGTATNFILYSGGDQYVTNGGSAINTTISAGSQHITYGGNASLTTISSGGIQIAEGDSSNVFNTIIKDGGLQVVSQGAVGSDTVAESGGIQLVSHGGTVYKTTINSGALQFVGSDGVINDTTINNGGYSAIFAGAQALGTTTNQGTLDLTEYDHNALNLSGIGGTVLIGDPEKIVHVGRNVVISDLSGSQTFVINTDLANNKADLISITNSDAGTHYIKIGREATDARLLEGLSNHKAKIVETPTGGAVFMGVLSQLGGLNIMPNIEQEGNYWYLVGYGKNGPNKLAQTAASAANMTYGALLAGDNETLRKRMGELRDHTHNAGVWVKIATGQQDVVGENMSQTVFQGGYDKVNKVSNGKTVTGIMVEHLNGSTSYAAGSGKINNTRAGLYHTWLGNDGQYYDLILKTGRMNNNFSAYDPNQIKGSYGTWNTSISAEYGRRLELQSGYYLTPMLRLTLGKINSAQYTADNGTSVNQDAINSLMGRIGIGIGRKLDKVNWYANAALVHEFSAASKVTVGSGEFAYTTEQSYKGTAFELALGTTIQVGDKGQFYTDLTKSFGGKVRNKWQLQAGYRIGF